MILQIVEGKFFWSDCTLFSWIAQVLDAVSIIDFSPVHTSKC